MDKSTATPECCVKGANVAPKSLLFKDQTKTYTTSETGYALTSGTYQNKDLCNKLAYTTTATDHTFTCVLSMYENSLESATAKVDIFMFS